MTTDELAGSNVNRTYSLAASCIAIFTFLLFFLYPRFASGEIRPWLFQGTLLVMGVATFSFVFASLYYFGASVGNGLAAARRADRFWLLGYTLLFLVPSLILFTVRLGAVGAAWFALWLLYLVFVIPYFTRIRSST